MQARDMLIYHYFIDINRYLRTINSPVPMAQDIAFIHVAHDVERKKTHRDNCPSQMPIVALLEVLNLLQHHRRQAHGTQTYLPGAVDLSYQDHGGGMLPTRTQRDVTGTSSLAIWRSPYARYILMPVSSCGMITTVGNSNGVGA